METLSPIVTKLAICFAGEMLHLATIQDKINALEARGADDDELDDLKVMANCLVDATSVLKGCFLALYPQFMSDPVDVYKWALASFNDDGLSELQERALVSLQLNAKEELGDYRTEIEKLPAFDAAMVEIPAQQDEDPNLRGKLRQRGRDFKDSPFMHKQERRLHRLQSGAQKIPRAIKGAFAKVRGRLHKVRTKIADRPRYRIRIVKEEREE